jgi:hypothetical protein
MGDCGAWEFWPDSLGGMSPGNAAMQKIEAKAETPRSAATLVKRH